MTGTREAQLLEAVNLLAEARRTLLPIAALPPALLPATPEEVAFVQDSLAALYGPIGGWKVGAASSEATPTCAPMPAAWMAPSGATLHARALPPAEPVPNAPANPAAHHTRGIEPEIAFLLASDLPARATPYTTEEVLAAVASIHPAIEVLDTGLAPADPGTPEARTAFAADLQRHGAFIHGAPAQRTPGGTSTGPAPGTLDFSAEHLTLAIDGVIRFEATNSNPAQDLARLLTWLANQGTRTGGLRAGQWITTGSWLSNGPNQPPRPGAEYALPGASIDVTFTEAGRVSLCLA